jgi:hypothetical protein
MTVLIPLLPFLLLFLFGRSGDPAPGLFTSKSDAARYECVRTTREAVSREKPGALKERAPRGDFLEEELFRCDAPLFARGDRPAQGDALLDTLSEQINEIVAGAEVAVPNAPAWSALAHHGDNVLARKIRFALEVALRSREKAVESELPHLSVADIVALSQKPPQESYPLLCAKLPSRNKAWLAAFSVDAKETVLHAGVCHDEVWTWLL